MATKKTPFSIRKRLDSFRYAGKGFAVLTAYEHNFRIHLIATLIALILGFWLKISPVEWCVIIFAIGIVLCAEALNTAIEVLCDRVTTDNDPLIGRAKDIAAAGVLFTATAALLTGIIIFLPKLILLLE